MVRCSVVWCDVVWCGVVWFGVRCVLVVWCMIRGLFWFDVFQVLYSRSKFALRCFKCVPFCLPVLNDCLVLGPCVSMLFFICSGFAYKKVKLVFG